MGQALSALSRARYGSAAAAGGGLGLWARPFLWVLVLAAAGCTSIPGPVDRPAVRVTGSGVDLDNGERVRAALYEQYAAWEGTPYRYGGLGAGGVDCSGLVYKTFLSAFGLLLPRTTDMQAQIGVPVARQDLRPGDLVFFTTGWKQRHVGIYVQNARFLHASTSVGVTLSSLRNPYWAGHYTQARRVVAKSGSD